MYYRQLKQGLYKEQLWFKRQAEKHANIVVTAIEAAALDDAMPAVDLSSSSRVEPVLQALVHRWQSLHAAGKSVAGREEVPSLDCDAPIMAEADDSDAAAVRKAKFMCGRLREWRLQLHMVAAEGYMQQQQQQQQQHGC